MHLTQLRQPLQRVVACGCRPLVGGGLASSTTLKTPILVDRFAQLQIGNTEARRYASVKSQGAYKLKPKRTIPKKLGAKRTGDQYVLPGTIIYKQRGTKWHPGENTFVGRDHSIHSAVSGYVKYYRDPKRHPNRQYIGVVFNKEDVLPYPEGMPRKRKLNMVAVPRKEVKPRTEGNGPSGIPIQVIRRDVLDKELNTLVAEATEGGESGKAPADAVEVKADTTTPKFELKPVELHKGIHPIMATILKEKFTRQRQEAMRKAKEKARRQAELDERKATRVLHLQSDYSYRESNWEIGRLIGDAGSIPGTEKTWSRKKFLRTKAAQKMKTYNYARYKRAVAARNRKVRSAQKQEEIKARSIAIKAAKVEMKKQLAEQAAKAKAAEKAAEQAAKDGSVEA